VERLLGELQGVRWLIASLLYGAGLRVMECLRLRVKDVDLGYRQVLVRDGKGEKDRVTILSEKLVAPLSAHLARVKSLHARDLAAGYGEVHLPYALARKYPRAGYEWVWQYVFRPRTAPPIRRTGWCVVTICTIQCRSARSDRPRTPPGLRSA